MLTSFEHQAPFPSLFIHGAGGNNFLWRRTLQYLSGNQRGIAVNLPGHPSGEITCKSMPDYSDAVRQFIHDSGTPRPVVCGHSMGSAVALQLAIDHPEDIGGLILVGAGAKMGVDPVIVQGLKNSSMRAIEEIITPRSFYNIDLGLGRDGRAALSISNLPVFLNDYLASTEFDVSNELPMINAKTLVLCGDRDKMTPPEWAHHLNSNILDSQVYFVRDSGHMLPLEKPASLASLIQGFLSSFNR